MNINLNEGVISSPNKVPSRYTLKEYVEIVDVFSDGGYTNSFMKAVKVAARVGGADQEKNEEVIDKFDLCLRTMFHENVKKILFYPYDDLGLLVNEDMDDIQTALYYWRLNRGK